MECPDVDVRPSVRLEKSVFLGNPDTPLMAFTLCP
jgi:hypothetical protein